MYPHVPWYNFPKSLGSHWRSKSERDNEDLPEMMGQKGGGLDARAHRSYSEITGASIGFPGCSFPMVQCLGASHPTRENCLHRNGTAALAPILLSHMVQIGKVSIV